MSRLPWFLLALAVGALVFFQIQARSLEGKHAELVTDMLIDSAKIDSLELALATERRSGADLLADHEDLSEEFRAQGERLDRAQARIAILTRAEVTAGGDVESDAVVFGPPDTVVTYPDSIAFDIEDGALDATSVCRFTPLTCSTSWSLVAEIALLHTQGPDGRLFVTAESATPNVDVAVDALEWVPPDEPSWWSDLWTWGGVGVGLAAGAGTVALGGSVWEGAQVGAGVFGVTKLLQLVRD